MQTVILCLSLGALTLGHFRLRRPREPAPPWQARKMREALPDHLRGQIRVLPTTWPLLDYLTQHLLGLLVKAKVRVLKWFVPQFEYHMSQALEDVEIQVLWM